MVILRRGCCSLAKLCPTHCDSMDCSMPGFPVLHYLPEFAQTHVHWVGNAIQSSHPLFPLLLLPSVFPSIFLCCHIIFIINIIILHGDILVHIIYKKPFLHGWAMVVMQFFMGNLCEMKISPAVSINKKCHSLQRFLASKCEWGLSKLQSSSCHQRPQRLLRSWGNARTKVKKETGRPW